MGGLEYDQSPQEGPRQGKEGRGQAHTALPAPIPPGNTRWPADRKPFISKL